MPLNGPVVNAEPLSRKAGTPAWLSERIEERRRFAKTEQCPRCDAAVLKGPSDDDMYWIATVDPEPVDAFTEAIEYVKGRLSYDLLGNASQGFRLATRFPHHIAAPPKWPVLLDHECER